MPEEAPGQEPAATTEATPLVTETTTAIAPEAEADIFDNEEVQSFDRDYVKKLRESDAKHRVEAKEAKKYAEAFSGFDEGSQQVLVNLISTLKSDTKAGVEQMKAIIEFLSPEDAAAVTEAVEGALDEGEGKPELSVEEQVQKVLAERDQTQKQQAEVQSVIDKAGELGYPEGDPDHITLLWIAVNQTGNDIEAAAKVLEARNQKIIDDYIAKKTASNDAFTKPSAGTNPGAADADKAKTWKDARSRVEARIDALAAGGD